MKSANVIFVFQIFVPSDPKLKWTLVKMWFNNAEAQVHESTIHLGQTRNWDMLNKSEFSVKSDDGADEAGGGYKDFGTAICRFKMQFVHTKNSPFLFFNRTHRNLSGLTHLLMETISVSAKRQLSPSHPVFRMMAPHFQYLYQINA